MPQASPNLVARGNIAPCRFVMQDTATDHGALQATANANIIGVSCEGADRPPLSDLIATNYAARDGETFRLHGDGDITTLELGDTVTAGDRLKSDADGKGVPIATTGTTIQKIGARALESGVAGEKVRVQVLIAGSERPALV
jgi:hypothetical protein